MKTTHDAITAHLELALADGYETRREFNTTYGRAVKADLVGFSQCDRLPEVVIEVKPSIDQPGELVSAINQLLGYVAGLKDNSPHASLLPIVVAKHISPKLDGRPYKDVCLVWTVAMFDALSRRRLIPMERYMFLQQRDPSQTSTFGQRASRYLGPVLLPDHSPHTSEHARSSSVGEAPSGATARDGSAPPRAPIPGTIAGVAS